ncbi:hypothetical protein A2W14_04695 [Candidatus Gottesmanbacteria bacterium RBG_16_37_8]|uniref:Probable DNA ligase n=1 Tax=Candidatus Gottesmanbacteria bacterium RBG_16_37_8 TaxID=1798371 RepID=A0A1F5YUQ5_9BACT|nr:MAG: hypothetical protein A2W14_04695 [Candidatus Gottesmanbacteria bacterium RBG_16_37_8]
MTFKRLAEYLQRLEETTLRNKITEILAELYKETNGEEIGMICQLLQGRVAPLYEAIEFGVADKMMIRAIGQGLNVEITDVAALFRKTGDLGITVESIKNQPSGIKYKERNTITEVYEVLFRLATSGGEGSQEEKIKLMGELIKDLDPLSCRYVVRIPIGRLRLGFSDMTVLDSLSWMIKGTKELRPTIEKAYNVRPDISFISSTLKEKGIKGLAQVKPQVGTPILMARAERMTNGADIIEKIGKCAIEPKYDGFRVQGHKRGNKVELFSRNLENVTLMYPDIVKGIIKQVKANEAIIEGEAVAFNPNTGEYLPFQETVQRKRKYNIEAYAREIPLKLFAFELLYRDGISYLGKPFEERRSELEKIVAKGDTILVSQEEVVGDAKRLEEIFQDAVSRGLEGVMAKKLDGIYRAGSRDFNWIKYKRSYAGKLADTIDCVVLGYDYGQGKRTGFGIGDFLIGVYDDKDEKFQTVAKIGTGLTDEEWKKIKLRSDKLKVKNKPENYDVDKMMECDVWITPLIVVEIRADEITRSPVHTAGRVMKPSISGKAFDVEVAGLALRFPRLERFRDDKKPMEVTTLKELKKLYEMQGKK